MEHGLERVRSGQGRRLASRDGDSLAAGRRARRDRGQGRLTAGPRRLPPEEAEAGQWPATPPPSASSAARGEKLFLEGERCFTDKCGVERRAYPPGDHRRGRMRQSEYRVRLRAKQKRRRYYQVLESQFRAYYDKASRQDGVTGEDLLRLLESRLDDVLVPLGFTASRGQARQLVGHRPGRSTAPHGGDLVPGARQDVISMSPARLPRTRFTERPGSTRPCRPRCRPITIRSSPRSCASRSAPRSRRRCRSS